MKKIGIVTILGFDNYGNRLQNYALQQTINKIGFDCITINNQPFSNTKNKYLLRIIKNRKFRNDYSLNLDRKNNFAMFNKNINISQKKITPFYNPFKDIDTYVVGSDQVWNPNFSRLREIDLLNFPRCKNRISYAASFGIENLPKEYVNKTRESLKKFKNISVREEAGKKIIEKITSRNDVEVLIDPTMLLSSKEWDSVIKKPKQIDNYPNKKYILNYFLGELSNNRKKEIERIAIENDCFIINLLDKNDPFYSCGPSEFLYLEKNAFLICTDSFHSSVFAIIFNRPFVVFEREEKGADNINSRIETLVRTFNLKDREYNNKKITEKNISHNYSEAYKVLELEKKKSIEFLKKSLVS